MKRIITLIAVMTMLSITLNTEALGQRGMTQRGGGGWGVETPYGKMYNPQTVETISGEVVSVNKITPMKDMYYGIQLILKTSKETIAVHLGPGWFVESQNVKIMPKDKIEVIGSRITFEGKPALIAAQITKGGAVMKLRDKSGFPVWSRWRRR